MTESFEKITSRFSSLLTVHLVTAQGFPMGALRYFYIPLLLGNVGGNGGGSLPTFRSENSKFEVEILCIPLSPVLHVRKKPHDCSRSWNLPRHIS